MDVVTIQSVIIERKFDYIKNNKRTKNKNKQINYGGIMVDINNVKSAYRKIKNDIYFSNNVHYKKMVADFESKDNFEDCFKIIADIYNGNENLFKKYLNKIKIFALPKKFKLRSEKDENNNKIVYGSYNVDEVETVNFFIDAPIEIFILDAMITLDLGKVCHENDIITCDATYGNVLSSYKLYDLEIDNSTFFDPYFYNYSSWRNEAFSFIEKNNDKMDLVLINYDIKQFYYYCQVSFNFLKEYTRYKNDYIYGLLEKIYTKYKKILLKYKDLECPIDRYPLPIGLYTSKVISNICLDLYDNYIKNTIGKNGYYGRYVDDMILVYPADFIKNDKLFNIKEFIENSFPFLEYDDENYYIPDSYVNIFSNDSKIKLTINGDKIDCYYFKKGDNNLTSTIYKNKILKRASDVGYYIDEEVDEKFFIDRLYTYKDSRYLNKISDLKNVTIDKYELSILLTKLTNLFKNVDYKKNKKELNSVGDLVVQCLKDDAGINFYRQWEKIFTLLNITNPKSTMEYYNIMKNYLENHINYECKGKNEYLNTVQLSKLIKKNLLLYLKICFDLAKASNKVNKNYNDKWIKSLMVNKNLIEKPLVLFSKGITKSYIYDLDINKFNYLPYWISLEEISLYYSIQNTIGNGKYYTYDELIDRYCSINKILKTNFKTPDKIKDKKKVTYNDYEFHTWEFEDTSNNPNVVKLLNQVLLPIQGPKEDDEKFFERLEKDIDLRLPYANYNVGIVSLPIDLNEIKKGVKKKKNNIDYWYKLKLNHILNEAIYNGVDHLVFPELSIPFEWLKELMFYSKKHGIQVTCGLQFVYEKDLVNKKSNVYNCVTSIYPFKVCGVYNLTYLDFREKKYYSPDEKALFKKTNLEFNNDKKRDANIVNFRDGLFTNKLCYELTSIKDRANLVDKITNLFVPVLNRDTNYFSAIVDSTSRELFCYVSISNTSVFGDSRVTGPFSSVVKDIVKLKGGQNFYLAVGTVNIDKLLNARKGIYDENDELKFKPLCADSNNKAD